MLPAGTARLSDQLLGTSAPRYERHRPEQTLLYQIVDKHYPEFLAQLAVEGKSLPDHVQREFTDYLKCGLLEHGFLRVRCESCHHEKLVAFSCKRRGFCPSCGARRMVDSAALLVDEVLPKKPIRQWVLTVPFPLRFLFAAYPELMSKVLGIVTRALSTHLTHQAGFKKKDAYTGAVTLIQRFGSALNLNIHFHMLFLDGVYVQDSAGNFIFHYNKAPTVEQLTEVLHVVSQRVSSFLERQGLLERDEDNSYLTLDGLDEDPMGDIHSHSVTYRIAMGPQRGRKVFALQTIPPKPDLPPGSDRVAKLAGFSLHAGVAAKAHQRNKVERLCRYIARPAVSEKRLSLTATGKVRYELKTPYRNGTTHVIFEPVDFIARLAALVPKPRVNLTRFHGVFAPNSKHRIHVTPAKRGKGRKDQSGQTWIAKTPAERHAAMTWMQRLKRVFDIDIKVCEKCKGPVKIIACMEDPVAIEKILRHLNEKAVSTNTARLPPGRAPPQIELFDRS
jgi:ribosomal protein S27E